MHQLCRCFVDGILYCSHSLPQIPSLILSCFPVSARWDVQLLSHFRRLAPPAQEPSHSQGKSEGQLAKFLYSPVKNATFSQTSRFPRRQQPLGPQRSGWVWLLMHSLERNLSCQGKSNRLAVRGPEGEKQLGHTPTWASHVEMIIWTSQNTWEDKVR